MSARRDSILVLVEACAEVNQAAECASWFSAMVAERVAFVTEDVNALTVGELRRIVRECRDEVYSETVAA